MGRSARNGGYGREFNIVSVNILTFKVFSLRIIFNESNLTNERNMIMIKLIVDSTCDLTLEQAKEWGIHVIPLSVCFEDGEYLDKYEISNEEFYEKLEASENLPSTALVSVGAFADAYEQYPDDDIIVLTISSELSGTNNSARLAKEMVKRDNIYIVDSLSASLGLGLLAEKAVGIIQEKSAEQAAEILSTYAQKVRVVAVVDTMKYLVKGGRVSAIQGSVGGLIGIKPLICVEDGVISSIGKGRGMKNATNKLIEVLETKMEIDFDEDFAFATAGEAQGLDYLKEKLNQSSCERLLSIGSVVGTHTGPGVIAAAFFVK